MVNRYHRHTAALALVVAIATGCADKAAEETDALKRDMANGRFQSAYNEARSIEANPSQYSPETLAYAKSVKEQAENRLQDHYGGNLRAQVATGNIDTALGMWTEIQEKSPELVEKDMDLYRRMMRVYATRKLWDKAIETAETVRSKATKMEDREDAEQFIDTYRKLLESKEAFDQLQAQVVAIGEKTGIELGGGIGCGASDKLSPEDKAVLDQWEKAFAKMGELNYSLTQLLPPPPSDEPNAEATGSTG